MNLAFVLIDDQDYAVKAVLTVSGVDDLESAWLRVEGLHLLGGGLMRLGDQYLLEE